MNKFNKGFIYFICIVSAMGGLLFGYDWVVIGGAKPFYEVFFGIENSPEQQGLAMSIALAGCLIGAMMSGILADRLGRKPLLITSAFIFLVSAYGTGAFDSFEAFLAARCIGGIGIGIASGLSPMYIAEVAPTNIRGKLVSLNQLTIVLGILGAQIVNYLIAEPMPAGVTLPDPASWNVMMGWRWMFWSAAFPAAAFLLLAFFIPESPRWLTMKGNVSKADAILTRIGGKDYAISEIKSVQAGIEKENSENRGGLRILFSGRYRGILILGLVIAVFQQWCGTNVIFNYAQEIFSDAGYDLGEMLFNIVLTGITNVVFTFVAIYTIDRLGRKKLMLIGATGLALVYTILGFCYWNHVTGFFMIILVVAAIAFYAMTLGPVTWVLISELFPNQVRAVAVATCTFALWVGSITLTYSFPLLNVSLGSYGTFWIYAAICALGSIFFAIRLPETKGKSLEQIEKELTDDENEMIMSTDF
ncbi:MAG: sugar porter family MFS transporter [Muribaculaceae bacterium]|nr:sugar porter family MFS transporter [Muribaculaceae bacterium]